MEKIYKSKEPLPRVRDPSKPMQVICPGFPRCGTESLQVALIKLGYDYTYHGWDIIFEEPNYSQAWSRLARKKWFGTPDGDSNITAADFDQVLGHSIAVTDAAASVFAAELIAAYPDAKVVLNGRKDLDAWHRSVVKNLVETAYENWVIYIATRLAGPAFWSWTVFENYLWRGLFRDDNVARGIRSNGKWIYKEHYNMIRGLVPKDNLLEWTVEDGWEPLCKLLGKEIPDEEFPKVNDTAAFAAKEGAWHKRNSAALLTNMSVFVSVVAVGVAAIGSYRRSGRVFEHTTHAVNILKGSIGR
ncbi:hypothetical protein M409DRAFT_37876 [Zasmidium cellare ATCC 36951]|uniref:NAD dependent epimerase/dehydratase n=1 Tax=Zasmidium cellare ATCC 36951 TaxID=1080233 RepID=A0A6A6C0L6_ZASCE|nr:uncharacterized protein M409DRAFT_37876 [Zasmidium cellare ATCC 36951]KAF2159700.1 hypothetical protein M409DRAFT_37876 [Zasmidium cellare ATCC 36951]